MGILPMSSGSPILGQDAQATWKIGLIRSLAEKRDADSVALIAPLLTDEKLGRAAAKALGKIASPAAVEALWGVFATQPYASESLVCAANHNPALTTAIAQKLYTQSKDSGTRTAAITLLAPSVPSDAFSSADLRIQKAAIDAAPVATVTEMLPKLSPAGKVFALRRIDSEKAALECAADKDETVRVAALEAFARIGTAYSVPVLLKAAATGTDAEKSAAAASLARVNGTGAGEAIERQAGQGDSATRVLAINAMTARAAKSSLPVLLQYCADPDANVSRAALQAVSKLGGDESLDNLVKFVLSGKPGAKEALQTVANRSTNKTGVGQKLAAQAANATGPQLTAILDVMSLVGGESALQEVVKFTGSTNEEIKDGAIRALCQWRDWPAVKPLLTVIAAPGVKQVH
jgi:HEAT repeat protein